jgi:hypothetical protein
VRPFFIEDVASVKENHHAPTHERTIANAGVRVDRVTERRRGWGSTANSRRPVGSDRTDTPRRRWSREHRRAGRLFAHVNIEVRVVGLHSRRALNDWSWGRDDVPSPLTLVTDDICPGSDTDGIGLFNILRLPLGERSPTEAESDDFTPAVVALRANDVPAERVRLVTGLLVPLLVDEIMQTLCGRGE